MCAMLSLCLSAEAAGSVLNKTNMNPNQPYLIANAMPGHEQRSATFIGESFTVYSPPLRYRYSEVFWKSMAPVALPKEIVDRYANSTIAITGWEVDVVRRSNTSVNNQDIHYDDGNDQSVPCYESYNHHYGANIKGKGLEMLKPPKFPSHGAGGDQIKFIRDDSYQPVLLKSGEPIPGVQSFNEHNGNEARQSYHGLPSLGGKQNVQPIFGPETFIMSPMQINTKNPDKKRWPGPRGGPLPRASSAPPNASYSGILECPCTDRITKELSGHVTVAEGKCNFEAGVTAASECFTAAAALGMVPVLANVTSSNTSAPAGCFAVREQAGFQVVYNTAQGPSPSPSPSSGSCVFESNTDYNHGMDVPSAPAATKEACCALCQARSGCAGSTFYKQQCYFKSEADFAPAHRKPFPGAVACRADKSERTFISVSTVGAAELEDDAHAGAECGSAGSGVVAGDSVVAASSGISLSISASKDSPNVTISLSGPADVWFGVGLNASSMLDRPYAFIVDGKGGVTERRLGMQGSQNGHDPGVLLAASVHVVSSAIQDGTRTVTLARAVAGASIDHYSFPASLVHTGGELPFISAHGTTVALSQHAPTAFASSMLTMAQVGSSVCICRGGAGKINGVPYNPHCIPYPKSSMLPQHNPTCDVSTYVGGLACCKNTFLLDQDQAVPEEVDTVYYKWRFYFQDFSEATMTPTLHLEWQLGHIEYDVPKALPGTPPEDMVHELSSQFTTRDMMMYSHPGCDVVTEPYCADADKVTDEGIGLVMAGGHCHAPACISLELYNADTGALLCRVTPVHGQSNDSMDEDGYLWLPPCVWGDAKDGLQAPPVLHLDTNFTSIKRTNNSVYHYGVMAIWQMRGIYL